MAQSLSVDLNCDLGESFGRYELGQDAEMMPLITSANIACGFHAGDPRVMAQTVSLAKQHQVSVGAHPGYPDLQGFGRRAMGLSLEDIQHIVLYQLGALGEYPSGAKSIMSYLGIAHVFPGRHAHRGAVSRRKTMKGVGPDHIQCRGIGQPDGVALVLRPFSDTIHDHKHQGTGPHIKPIAFFQNLHFSSSEHRFKVIEGVSFLKYGREATP